MNTRWSDYFADEDFIGFWRYRLQDPDTRVLVIVGLGFDPRSLVALRALAALGFDKRVHYAVLRLSTSPSSRTVDVATEELMKANDLVLASLVGCHCEASFDVPMLDDEGHSVAGRRTLAEIANLASIFPSYTDVLVDISGMPRAVFFPLLAYLIKLADSGGVQNLHATVVEDPSLDARISGREYGQADFLHTFRMQDDNRLVWLPVIGPNESTRLEKIHSKLKGNCIEICPILPFPALPLRRVDDILVKQSELLFDGFQVSQENLLLCDERTPFDIYRKILEVEEYYRTRLGEIEDLGNVTTVVSPLSSKTLSLGMLLAAVERTLPVCHVEPGSYSVEADTNVALTTEVSPGPVEFWLTGEPYL